MNLPPLLLTLSALGLVLWWGRRLPLTGWRKRLALGCRLAAVGALGMALWGPPARGTRHVARQVIYLVDGSASIDPGQRAWMARRIASLEELRPAPVERAIVAFGRDARLVVPFGQAALTDPDAIQRALDDAGISRDQTNVEAGLLASLSLVSPQHRAGVVLLSDGRETAGNVTGILAYARRFGVVLFPAPPPVLGESKTSWEALVVPPVVRRGSPVSVQLVVANPPTKQGLTPAVFGGGVNGTSRVRHGQITVSLQGVPIKRQGVSILQGWQVFSVTVPAIQLGTLALDVELSVPEEGLSEHRRVYTEVEGPPQVLVVGDRMASMPALATALHRREMEIAVARPGDLPTEAAQLLNYDAVVLFNLPPSSLSDEQVAALQAYLERFGGGLVTVGLGGDFAYEIEHASPLKALLPVTFDPRGLRESKRRVCIVLLIDRSASMLGPRIAATKRAAVALVKQLAPEDLVGILAFDTKPYVVAEVQPAGQVGAELVEKLVKLRSTGGTDVYPALLAAADRLELTGAILKHIILLSDGNTPFNEKAYMALMESLTRDGTTISTIGIGSAFVNTDYLKWLAQSTGGTFYSLRTLEELPHLLARDTQQALERLPFSEGRFRPTRSQATDWFPEVPEWPVLRGFFTATAKPGARVDLTIQGDGGERSAVAGSPAPPTVPSPLLARWSIGRGRAVSFTSDADTRWSPDWIRWTGFDGTWAHIVRWAMRPRSMEELFAWVDESHESPLLILEGELHDPQGTLLDAEGSRGRPLALVQTGTWRWQTSLEQVPSGWYQLALESSPTAQAADPASTVFARRWVQVGTLPMSRELIGQPPHEALLRQISRSTAGAYDLPDGAFLPPTTTSTTTTPRFVWWLPLVLLAFLADIALRGSSML